MRIPRAGVGLTRERESGGQTRRVSEVTARTLGLIIGRKQRHWEALIEQGIKCVTDDNSGFQVQMTDRSNYLCEKVTALFTSEHEVIFSGIY